MHVLSVTYCLLLPHIPTPFHTTSLRSSHRSGGTELRKAAYEFAEEEGITVEGLREGVRRLVRQLENMQPDPYGKFTRIVNDLSRALEVGTEEEESVYKEHLYSVRKEGPGWFQTYKMKEVRRDKHKVSAAMKMSRRRGAEVTLQPPERSRVPTTALATIHILAQQNAP